MTSENTELDSDNPSASSPSPPIPPAAPKKARAKISSNADPRFSLKGNTLRVYMYAVRNGKASVGVREIQKELNLSSPTLAKYHLEKLREMGLLKQDEEGDGSYTLLKEVKVDVLQPFMTLGSLMIPRLFTYALMVSVLFLYLVIAVVPSGNIQELDFFAIVIGTISVFAFWYETFRSWRNSPT